MSTTSFAATTSEQLQACDEALNAKIKEADLCDYGIKIRDDALEMSQKEVAELRASRSAFYNNPWFWGLVGVLAGGYLGVRAAK